MRVDNTPYLPAGGANVTLRISNYSIVNISILVNRIKTLDKHKKVDSQYQKIWIRKESILILYDHV